SHADLLAARPAPGTIAELWEELRREGAAAREDDTGALWRFPGVRRGRAEAAAAWSPDGRAPLPGAAFLAEEAARLGRRREAAARRRARRFSAAAPGAAHGRPRE